MRRSESQRIFLKKQRDIQRVLHSSGNYSTPWVKFCLSVKGLNTELREETEFLKKLEKLIDVDDLNQSAC